MQPHGLDILGSTMIGAWSLSEYKWGETQVQQLVAYFDHAGRPKEYEQRVMALYGAYEKERTSSAILAAVNSDGMLNLGQQASSLMAEIQSFMQDKARKAGGGAVIPQGVPPAPPQSSAPPKSPSLWDAVPKWAKYTGGVAVVGAALYFTVPLVAPLVAGAIARRRS